MKNDFTSLTMQSHNVIKETENEDEDTSPKILRKLKTNSKKNSSRLSQRSLSQRASTSPKQMIVDQDFAIAIK